MKKIVLFISALSLSGCIATSPKEKLDKLISSYEDYQANTEEENPLGVYTETRFETYARFCDSLKTEVEKIDPKTLDDDTRITSFRFKRNCCKIQI